MGKETGRMISSDERRAAMDRWTGARDRLEDVCREVPDADDPRYREANKAVADAEQGVPWWRRWP
jgi:hypothetical protein